MVYEQPELIAQDAPILDQKDIVGGENTAEHDFNNGEESKHVPAVADRENTEHDASSRSCRKRRWDSEDVKCEEDSESDGPSCSKTRRCSPEDGESKEDLESPNSDHGENSDNNAPVVEETLLEDEVVSEFLEQDKSNVSENGDDIAVAEGSTPQDEVMSEDPGQNKLDESELGQVQQVAESSTNNKPLPELFDLKKEFSRNWTKKEIRQQYPTLCQKLYTSLKTSAGSPLSPEKLQECLDMICILEAKFRKCVQTKQPKPKNSLGKYPETKKEVLDRMQGPEEEVHPWSITTSDQIPSGGILYRAWDKSSQCQILQVDFGLLAGAPHSNFKTEIGRNHDLQCHANWGNREKTPFISSTPSVEDIVRTWIFGFRRRQKPPITTTRVTAINVNARVEAGWPLLKMKTEMVHYQVEIPACCTPATYENEYLLPFRVRQEEIIWTWHFNDIKKWLTEQGTDDIVVWEARVAKPMYAEHERSRKAGDSKEETQRRTVALMTRVMPIAVHTHWHAAMQGCLVG